MVSGKVRIYGVTLGHGSWSRVTAGVCQGLQAHGLFAGLVPVDAFDEDETYPGHDASIGLVIGPSAEGFQLARAAGWHREILVLLAPNSTWLPDKLIDFLASNGARLGAPSAWGASVINASLAKVYPGAARAFVYQHGVSSDFAPNAHDEGVMDHKFQKGIFRVLHLSSSTGERKGTRELVRAWQELKGEKKLPGGAYLDIIYNGHPSQIYKHASDAGEFPREMSVTAPVDLSPAAMSALCRQSHLVAQPSRAEGFGLVPLEAAASGVLPLMTTATGHAEYEEDVKGIYVFSGPSAPIDDGPGATAPELRAEDVKEALALSYEGHTRWRVEARERAPHIRKAWSWERVTETFLKKELEVRGWI
jgi:glycosyltransferase involved in cell wall biosynthesis